MSDACSRCGFALPDVAPASQRYSLHCQRCRHPLRELTTAETPFDRHAVTARTQPHAVDGLFVPTLPTRLAFHDDTASHPARTPPPESHSAVSFDFAPTPRPPCPAEQTNAVDEDAPPVPPAHVPGFRVDGVIGHGGMGSVYLARQLSLDRPVALKVMSNAWASDPVFVARFVREAYAAALLNHPNVVQIYDIGEAGTARYFSMEYVAGRSLADVLKADGKLEAETAVGYVLQAARGLKHAHDRGIIHRDIKPDNLLLDAHGVVKVADLGLVKTPDMAAYQDRLADAEAGASSGLHTLPHDMTGVRMALGTPAYMAPEQCRDAAAVDHRADVYSLGCTLYALLTGGPPFRAADAVGLMKKHAYEPLVPPDVRNPRIPAEVSAIVRRMMAKAAGDRPQTMVEVIRTLEQWLGVEPPARFTPREEQVAEVERVAARFFAAPSAVLRKRVVSGFVSGCVLAAVLLAFFGKSGWAFGLAGLVVQATVVHFIVSGVARKTYLFGRVKRFVAGMGVGDWVVAAGAVGLFAAFLWVSGLLAPWLGFGLLGAAAAVGLWYCFDRRVELDRYPALKAADDLVRRLKRQGVRQADAQQFVAKYSGRRWEEFFEAVFGFEAKLAVRAALPRGAAGGREKYAAWREPVVAAITAVEAARKKEREQALLERAEYERLVAAGLSKHAARKRATAAAEAMVDRACAIRESQADLFDPAEQSAVNPQFRGLLPQHSGAMPSPVEPPTTHGVVSAALDFAVGKQVRAVLAAVLIAACALWVYQNDLLRFGPRPDDAEDVTALRLEGVLPVEWTAWCDTANVGWGGILLLASLFYRGQRMGALTILGTAVAVLGHKFGIRTVEPIRDYHVAMLLGTVLALVGYRLGRR